MDLAFSIEMVIWVAVGGRATLVGAVLGNLLVRLAQSRLSEQFPAVWLFFQTFPSIEADPLVQQEGTSTI